MFKFDLIMHATIAARHNFLDSTTIGSDNRYLPATLPAPRPSDLSFMLALEFPAPVDEIRNCPVTQPPRECPSMFFI
jgi:hypothetical protein